MFLTYVDFLCVRFNFSWFLMVTLVSLCNSFLLLFHFIFWLSLLCVCLYVCLSTVIAAQVATGQ